MSEEATTRVDYRGIQALLSRAAGYSVASKCLEVQAAAEILDPSLRTADGVTLHEDARSWYIGARGEMRVGELLSALGPDWFVRHSVPIGAGAKDVDHLVIGPGGIFSINTKHHANASIWVGDFALRVNNYTQNYIKQSRRDGTDVAARLTAKLGFPVDVTATLAFLDAKSLVDKGVPITRGVYVVDAKRLVGWLRARPRKYSDTELALIKIEAEEPETWHVDPRAADTLRVMHRFERLVSQVEPAPPANIPDAAPSRRNRPSSTGAQRPPAKTAPTARAPYRAPHRSMNRARSKPAVRRLIGIWLSVLLVIVPILVFREIANQPCTSPLACMVPAIYMGLRSMLMLASVIAIVIGLIKSSVWLGKRLV